MSLTLYTADNISVKWNYYQAKSYDENWNESDLDAIHIDFTLLINWKLKTYWWSFIINKWEDNFWEWWFDGWTEWNMMYFMLDSLWYSLWGNALSFWQWVAKEWINRLINNM